MTTEHTHPLRPNRQHSRATTAPPYNVRTQDYDIAWRLIVGTADERWCGLRLVELDALYCASLPDTLCEDRTEPGRPGA